MNCGLRIKMETIWQENTCVIDSKRNHTSFNSMMSFFGMLTLLCLTGKTENIIISCSVILKRKATLWWKNFRIWTLSRIQTRISFCSYKYIFVGLDTFNYLPLQRQAHPTLCFLSMKWEIFGLSCIVLFSFILLPLEVLLPFYSTNLVVTFLLHVFLLRY